jgi:hypothetical protein
MEDLRNEEQIKKDEKSLTKRSIHTFTGHIPTIWQIIKLLTIKYFKYIVLVSVVVAILAYPSEIGTFIGNWSYDFWTGLTAKFN